MRDPSDVSDGSAFHTTDAELGKIFFLLGLAVGNGGIVFSLARDALHLSITDAIVTRVDQLEAHPQLGRLVPEFGMWQLRELVDRHRATEPLGDPLRQAAAGPPVDLGQLRLAMGPTRLRLFVVTHAAGRPAEPVMAPAGTRLRDHDRRAPLHAHLRPADDLAPDDRLARGGPSRAGVHRRTSRRAPRGGSRGVRSRAPRRQSTPG